MKTFAICALCLLQACALTPTQKKWTGIAASVLVVGAIAASQQDNGGSVTGPIGPVGAPGRPCTPQPDGSCR